MHCAKVGVDSAFPQDDKFLTKPKKQALKTNKLATLTFYTQNSHFPTAN
jgi:hypothetical protein